MNQQNKVKRWVMYVLNSENETSLERNVFWQSVRFSVTQVSE